MKVLLIVIAFFSAAIAFENMHDKRGEWGPHVMGEAKVIDAYQRIEVCDAHDSCYHDLKNLWTELVRADAQWFGKFLAFVIMVQMALLFLSLTLNYVQWRWRR
jgi:hypothetical protein